MAGGSGGGTITESSIAPSSPAEAFGGRAPTPPSARTPRLESAGIEPSAGAFFSGRERERSVGERPPLARGRAALIGRAVGEPPHPPLMWEGIDRGLLGGEVDHGLMGGTIDDGLLSSENPPMNGAGGVHGLLGGTIDHGLLSIEDAAEMLEASSTPSTLHPEPQTLNPKP